MGQVVVRDWVLLFGGGYRTGRVLGRFKSCSFELATQGSLDPNAVGSAVVRIDAQPVPMSMTNGWHLTSPTQLTLVGSACADWRKPATQAITFEFPCGALLVP